MKSIQDIIRQDIQAMKAYPVACVPENVARLDSMESPYDFPPAMQAELGSLLAKAPIRLYPHIDHDDLIPMIQKTFRVPENAAIATGNGSDELIQLLCMLVAKPNAKVLSIEPTFVMYQTDARLYGMEYISVPLNDDLTLNLANTLQAIEQHQPDLIFLAYPNNPTGTPYDRKDVEQIIQAATGLVVIDEAYGAFSSDSFLPQAGTPEKLLVLRTFSKIGFAGLRLGFISGSLNIIQELKKIIPPYNMNQLSLVAAKYAMTHYDWVEQNINQLKMEREIMFAALEGMTNVTAFPSEANFITVRVPDAEKCFDALLSQGFLIKKLHGSHSLLNNCLRITIGSPEQNKKVIDILEKNIS